MPGTVPVHQFYFVTANDNPQRDPSCWDFGTFTNGRFTKLGGECVTPPEARLTAYGNYNARNPPSTPPPPSPPLGSISPSPPAYSVYEFEITALRNYDGSGQHDGTQLGAIALFGYNGELLPIRSITNPNGQSPAGQGASNLFLYQRMGYTAASQMGSALALTSKWHDENFGANGKSTLRVELAGSYSLGGYRLITANDVPRRDPTSWIVKMYVNS